MKQLIECVPNFSEGRNPEIIKSITNSIESVEGVQLLGVEMGKDTHRTVVTFVGEPHAVVEAAFRAMRTAKECIDMSKHKGTHPRFGATDVLPLIPLAHITLEEVVNYAHQLAKRAGEELDYPIYCYEAAALVPERRNLAYVRAGEYEGLPEKLQNPIHKPDFGTSEMRLRTGATALGARNFLIAVNFNLNTDSIIHANAIAADVRESGRIIKDQNNKANSIRIAGSCRGTKAIGWYIPEYKVAQVSMNITDIEATPLHIAFEEVRKSAEKRGLKITGTEIIGLIPLQSMCKAGEYFLLQEGKNAEVSEQEKVEKAIESMGLHDLRPFIPAQKIIEYKMATLQGL